MKVTRPQKAFLDELIDNPTTSQTDAYIKTHKTNNRKTASVEATKTLKKPSSIIYLQNHVENATQTIIDLSQNAENEAIKLKASQDILDRTHGKATLKQITESTNLNIDVQANDELARDFLDFVKTKTTHPKQ